MMNYSEIEAVAIQPQESASNLERRLMPSPQAIREKLFPCPVGYC